MSDVVLSPEINQQFLIESLANGQPNQQSFVVEDFYGLVEAGISYDDQEAVAAAIESFATSTPVEFCEPPFADEEFTTIADRVEREVSDFIMNNGTAALIYRMGATEFRQVSSIYNTNNMLHFAKQLIERSANGLNQVDLEQIYRYRTIIKRLEGVRQNLAESYAALDYAEDSRRKSGARTWSGDVHEYGHRSGGVVDPSDYHDFADDERDDPGKQVLVVEKVPIKLTTRGDHYALFDDSK